MVNGIDSQETICLHILLMFACNGTSTSNCLFWFLKHQLLLLLIACLCLFSKVLRNTRSLKVSPLYLTVKWKWVDVPAGRIKPLELKYWIVNHVASVQQESMHLPGEWLFLCILQVICLIIQNETLFCYRLWYPNSCMSLTSRDPGLKAEGERHSVWFVYLLYLKQYFWVIPIIVCNTSLLSAVGR